MSISKHRFFIDRKMRTIKPIDPVKSTVIFLDWYDSSDEQDPEFTINTIYWYHYDIFKRGYGMSASNFNLRGIPGEVMSSLKKEAKRLHMSVNALALKMIKKGLGLDTERTLHHDLDHLSGSWSSEDENAFKKTAQSFETIDKELWS